ncbi:TIGR04211 family SH3 domain-containing protein [Desulfogranum marinum]|jgi:SH3 domain protein|uniref:TIGR04211 family SH3 domain-containing protein n=1 Tax=Desulfogranum marinum TaxID=453220 RepID=UPI001962BE17|nr:TIGR04211 family SH3 domain-containing protein [Desulfogranum marinum]MBM9512094.1 TIGR04211 family SH3 domain-containing protein [Desulfogranum marinum]
MKTQLFFHCYKKHHRSLLFAVGLSLFASTTAAAEMLYVQPSSEIPMRRGQGTDYKIVSIVTDGTAVEYISEKDGWAQVKLKNGKQGWILKRYLSPTPPLTEQVSQLSTEKNTLTAQVSSLQSRLNELTDAQGQTAVELSTCIAERTDIRDRYQSLERETLDVVQTKEALLQARKDIEQLKQENADVKIANSVLKKNESIKWFMAGSGVLLVGWLLGRISRKSRRKKPSLLS